MESGTAAIEKTGILHEEMDAIHYANNLYWKHSGPTTHELKADYESRNQRLEEIRAELAKLQSS